MSLNVGLFSGLRFGKNCSAATILVLVGLLISTTGCMTVGRVRSDTTLNNPMNKPMLYAKEVTIEVFPVNGCMVPESAFRNAVNRFAQYLPGQVQFRRNDVSRVVQTDKNGIEERHLMRFFKENYREAKEPGPRSIYVIVVPNVKNKRQLGSFQLANVKTRDGRETYTNVIILQRDAIKYFAHINGSMGEVSAWDYALFHYLAQAMGLPNRSNHVYEERYCTNPKCALHKPYLPAKGGKNQFGIQPSLNLCPMCRGEIAEALRTQPEELYTEGLAVPSIEWFNMLVKANPDHHEAYYLRANAQFKLEHFAEAKADYEDAYKYSFKDPIVMNRLAEFYATCPNEFYRDGQKALNLAITLNNETHFRDADFVLTLAKAYEELGLLDKATTYYKKATELMMEIEKQEDTMPIYQPGLKKKRFRVKEIR